MRYVFRSGIDMSGTNRAGFQYFPPKSACVALVFSAAAMLIKASGFRIQACQYSISYHCRFLVCSLIHTAILHIQIDENEINRLGWYCYGLLFHFSIAFSYLIDSNRYTTVCTDV